MTRRETREYTDSRLEKLPSEVEQEIRQAIAILRGKKFHEARREFVADSPYSMSRLLDTALRYIDALEQVRK